jgi:hypothetical protein
VTATTLDAIEHLRRIETFSMDQMSAFCMEHSHAVYPHDQIYGNYCTLQEYINCPPQQVYDYLSKTSSLQEWTYSLRDIQASANPDLFVLKDTIGSDTLCYTKTCANPEAMTVDYHCAWDQGEHLWMIYLMRVVPAPLVLNKPGAVVLWTNCHHPFYDKNPYPDKAPKERPVWVGDFWSMFYSGHWLEMQNLKRILEFRHEYDQMDRAIEVLAQIEHSICAQNTGGEGCAAN